MLPCLNIKMRHCLFGLVVFVASIGQVFSQPYIVRDLTAEQIFTRNCEGPVVDGRGRLFVVNVEQDGTIGVVQTEGRKDSAKAEVVRFGVLPTGSIGNSLRFGKQGQMYIADFKGHNVLVLEIGRAHV